MDQLDCRIVVIISGSGSNLQALINSSKQSNFEICAVISNRPDAFGLQRAADEHIPTLVLDHKSYTSRHEFDQALGDAITELDCDLIALAGFMRILGEDFVNRFKGKILNIHPSLLPKYAGINTHQRAIDAGDTEHGASIHFVTPALDGGPVIAQDRVKISGKDDAESLAARVQAKEHKLYPTVVSWFASGRLKMQDGKAYLDDKALPLSGMDISSHD